MDPPGAAPDGAIVGVDAAVDAADDASVPPAPPAGLMRWLVGDPADRVTTSRAGLILMGGGADVDAAFAWQRDRIGGGDVVVLRTSLADGYNSYLFQDIGGVDSVETLRVDTRALADDPYVRWTLEHAEAIFLAGGDQATYVRAWGGTAVARALQAAPQRGAVIGGTSAGCAFLGEIVYSALAGSVVTAEALANPYDARVTLAHDVLSLASLSGVVTDTHFGARDRMGRLLAFTARVMADGWSARPLGVGVDEATAVVIDETGAGRVLGSGSVYVIVGNHPPTTCSSGQPLAWTDVPVHELRAGDSMAFPSGATQVPARLISAAGGGLQPANPY